MAGLFVLAIEAAGRSSSAARIAPTVGVALLAAGMAAISLRRMRLAAERQRAFQRALQDQDDLIALHDRELAEYVAQCDAIQLRLTVEMAEKDDFIRSAAHDLGAPLRNISGMAAAVLLKHADELSPEAARRLHRIRANADAQRAMVNDLLELSRLKAAAPREDAVDLDRMVSELADLFENELTSRGITLRIDGQLPCVRADGTRLRQVFQNLIDNAIKYMGDGSERTIRIGAAVSGDRVVCTVTDTGTGVLPTDRARLFHPFGRGRSKLHHAQPGMGLGLAGVKSILESHGGSIAHDAAAGGGSVFTVTLGNRLIGPIAAEKPREMAESHT